MRKATTNNEAEHGTIIKIANLSKRYARKVVLSDVSLEINQGDSIAFIGHNGCGKSTLIKIIGGLLPFNSGNVLYARKIKFGYVPERFPAMNISALNYIKQIAAIAGLSPKESERKSMQLFESLFMHDMAEMPIRHLSKGTIQKVAVVQAFISPPDILLLDEPISGQDTASQQVFIDMVNRLNHEQGVTILCACHEDYMISAIARSVYEIIDGKLHKIEYTTEIDANKKIYKLHFVKDREINVNKNIADDLSHKINKLATKTEWLDNESTVVIYVTAINSDAVIREMLTENFMFRGINDEIIV